MTSTAVADNNHLQSTAAAAAVSHKSGTMNSLRDAVNAVNEHRRQMELRRMLHAARQSTRTTDWDVPVRRSKLDAMEHQLREAAALRGALDHAPVIVVPFSTTAPHTLRDMPPALARALGHVHDGGVRDRPLTRLFVAADVPRLQQALYDGEAVTLVASLRRIDGQAVRCSVHLAPRDPADPDWRWACIVRLPLETAQDSAVHADEPSTLHLPPKPNQRARLDSRPLQQSN